MSEKQRTLVGPICTLHPPVLPGWGMDVRSSRVAPTSSQAYCLSNTMVMSKEPWGVVT